MKLILLEKVAKLGDLGDMVNVKPGFGRNFLVPQGKAVPATKDNVAMFEARRAELETAANERLSTAQSRAESINEVEVEITANASDEGKLFGSIGPREVADAVSAKGFPLEKSEGDVLAVPHQPDDRAVSVDHRRVRFYPIRKFPPFSRAEEHGFAHRIYGQKRLQGVRNRQGVSRREL